MAKRSLKLHKNAKPRRNAAWVGVCPHSPAPPFCTVYHEAIHTPQQWDAAGRPNWVVLVEDLTAGSPPAKVWASTNVPTCRALHAPMRLPTYVREVVAGLFRDGTADVYPPRCQPFYEMPASVVGRSKLMGTSQREVCPDPLLSLTVAQTYEPSGTSPDGPNPAA